MSLLIFSMPSAMKKYSEHDKMLKNNKLSRTERRNNVICNKVMVY